MSDIDTPNIVAGLEAEVRRLRAGEQGNWREGTLPTAGQYFKRLHDLDKEQRLNNLDVLINAAEAGRQCAMGLHVENLSELRQRMMEAWTALSRIGKLCQDADSLVRASDITALLPEGLRRG